MLGGKDASTLETRATVALYTWKDEEGNWVEGRKAWLVVVDDLPIMFPPALPESTAAVRGNRINWLYSMMRTPARKSRDPSEGAGLTGRTGRPAVGNLAVTLTKSRGSENEECVVCYHSRSRLGRLHLRNSATNPPNRPGRESPLWWTSSSSMTHSISGRWTLQPANRSKGRGGALPAPTTCRRDRGVMRSDGR